MVVSGVLCRGLAPLEMVRDWGIPIISWSVLTTCRISVASGWKIEFGMGSVRTPMRSCSIMDSLSCGLACGRSQCAGKNSTVLEIRMPLVAGI